MDREDSIIVCTFSRNPTVDRNKKINRGHVPLEREAVDEVEPLPANKIKHNQIKIKF